MKQALYSGWPHLFRVPPMLNLCLWHWMHKPLPSPELSKQKPECTFAQILQLIPHILAPNSRRSSLLRSCWDLPFPLTTYFIWWLVTNALSDAGNIQLLSQPPHPASLWHIPHRDIGVILRVSPIYSLDTSLALPWPPRTPGNNENVLHFLKWTCCLPGWGCGLDPPLSASFPSVLSRQCLLISSFPRLSMETTSSRKALAYH